MAVAPGTPVSISSAADGMSGSSDTHPAISGEYWQRYTLRGKSELVELDYFQEPFRAIGANDKGQSNAKPTADQEDYESARNAYNERKQLF